MVKDASSATPGRHRFEGVKAFFDLPPPDTKWHRFVRKMNVGFDVIAAPEVLIFALAPFITPMFAYHYKLGVSWVAAIPLGIATGIVVWFLDPSPQANARSTSR